MKNKTQKKLSKRILSIITCVCLIAETFSSYGSLTAYATSSTQTTSSDASATSNITTLPDSVISNDASVTDNSTTTDTANSTDATTPTVPATSSDSTTSGNSNATNATTTSSSTNATNDATSSTNSTINTISPTTNTTDTTEKETLLSIDMLNFPDEIFLKYISSNYDTNKDEKLSQEEISVVKTMDVSNLAITSMVGIEYFTNLTNLNCSNNKLTSLEVDSLTNLVSLNCSNNELTSLKIDTLTNLASLDCSDNEFTSLNIDSLINLASLNCSDNEFTSLNIDFLTKLVSLDCSNNELTSLKIDTLTNLASLDCSNNELTSLKIDTLTNLASLDCSNNELTSLKIDYLTNLVSLNCSWNHLTSINVEKNLNLTNLECIANATAILVDDKSSFDLATLLDFNIEQTKNWSCPYTINDTTLTFDPTLTSSIIIYESNLNNTNVKEAEPIKFTLALYKGDFEPVEINEQNFPDTEFQKFVCTSFDKDKDNTLDSEELIPITNLNISNLNIKDLTGIQYFKNLSYFNYSSTHNPDINLSILPTTTILYCDNLPVVAKETDPSQTTTEDATTAATDTTANATVPAETLPPTINTNVPANTTTTTCTISFDSMGGSGSNPVTVNTNTAVDGSILPANPSKAGCTFDGWYFDNSFTNKFSPISAGLTQNITLYAKWNQLTVNSTKIKSAKNSGKGKLNISYNKIGNVAGYEVICSTSKNFKSNVRTATNNSTSVTIKGLIKNKTYYVKVRGYVVDSTGQNVYSDYSSVKNIKVTSGVSEVKATSTSAKINSCKITDANTVTIKAKANNVVKSSDSSYYLFIVPSAKTNLKGLQPFATSEKNTSMTFHANLDKDGANSLLQSKFVIAVKQKSTYKIISAFRYISNPEAVANYNYAFPTAPTKKGLQDYSSSLGVNHTVINIEVNDLIANPAEYELKSTVRYDYKGNTYYFRKDAVRNYANIAKYYSQKGAVVYAILLLGWSSKPDLITPAARQEGYAYYAWNTKDEAVKEQLEAAITYFAKYCCTICGDRPGISGWIVGNEVDNFDTWNYAGTSNLNSYAKTYADTFRLVYNATKSVNSNARVYISLDNMWGMSNEGSFGSKAFLDKFNSILESEGNIDWDIAYHPYPVPLTETKFWKNDFISNDENSDIINMKNLNVLTNYVKKHYGKDKRVILSEIGFSANSGEKLQAAAIAYAYYVAEFNPMVDAIIMRSMDDAPEEVAQGLAFGIKGRSAYDVFKYMDTPQSESYTKFALKVIGAKKWKSIVPKYNAKKFRSMPNR